MKSHHLILSLLLLAPLPAHAQENPTTEPTPAPATAPAAGKEDFDAFQKLLSGTVLRGQFTMTGAHAAAAPKEESYRIEKITPRSDDGRSWFFQASFRYGGKDWTVPLPIQVEWAGKTPIITLDNFTIPLMGTFGARVLFHEGRYAGTWSHGEVGGHLFGVLEKLEEEAE